MKGKHLLFAALIPLLFFSNKMYAQAPDLGVAATFALFTADGAFNGDPATSIIGDIGTNVGAFTPPGFHVGQVHLADPVSAQAAADVAIAYGFLAGLTCGSVLTTPLGNSQTLLPNIYCIGTAAVLNADLILDGGGDPGAIFIFQINGALSTNPFSNIILINGANLCNVYWQINGALNVGGNTLFQGTVIAEGAINLAGGAIFNGRGLSTAGAISTSANSVTLDDACLCMLDVTCPDPSGGSFECIGDIPAGNASDVTVNSACGTPSVTITETSTGTGCLNAPYTLTRTYTISDDGGNSTSCEVTYTAIDETVPTISCPANVIVSCASNVPAAAPTSTTSSDNCGGTVTVVLLSDVISNQICANQYTITRTFQASDLCGNSATCAQTITVNDLTAPTLTCPANVTVSCASSVPAPSTASVSASDLCGGTVTVAFVSDVISNQTCPNRFTVTRTYRATDLCGNSATCAQTITVNDQTAPTMTCPANVTVSCAGNVPAPSTASVSTTDLCGGTVTVAFVSDVISNQTCPNRFTVTRTYRATDLCGNSATCAQTITVNDQTAPTILCPQNVTVTCASSIPAPAPASIGTSDNCGGTVTVIHVSDVISNQICANRLTITRTYRATDVCGNSTTCAQIITVFDDIAPTFVNPPANITAECFSIPGSPPLPTATDNCAGVVTVVLLSEVQTPGICPVLYTITRTWRATDVCGNSSTAVQVVTIVDTYAPQFIVAPANVAVECNLNTNEQAFQDWLDNLGGAEIFDCSTITWTFTPSPFFIMPSMCGATSQRFIRFTATDECGNSSFQDASFTIMDMTPPTFTVLPQNLHIDCIQGGDQGEGQLPDWLENFGYAEVSDDCGEVFTSIVLLSSVEGCGNTFTRTYQFRATDECGNTNFVTATFAIIDTTAPVIVTCPPHNVLLTCEFDVPAPDTAGVEAYDECGAVTVTVQSIFTNGVGCVYWPLTTSYTYAVTDECGNVATCYQSFQVVDSIPPVYNGLDTIEVLCVSDLPGLGEIPDILAPFLVDNCYEVICVNEGLAATGPNWVTYCVKIKDLCGNWTDKFNITFIATGGCKPLCSAPQSMWGNPGGSINGMATTEAIEQLISKYGALKAGDLGKTISVTSAACVQNILPGNGNTNAFSTGHYVFGEENDCKPISNLLNADGTLKNQVAANVLALQLNIWYNLEFNERDLRVQLLAGLPPCLVEPVVMGKLEENHHNVQGLLNLSNDYLAGIGFYPQNFGGPLNSALENINSYWQNCQTNNPCSVIASVAGSLKTEAQEGLENGEVKLEGSNNLGPTPTQYKNADNSGYYEFPTAIPFSGNITLTPNSDNLNALNGVTTYDLVLISKHILGILPFNSPYNMIAADANKSGSITTFDVVELRKLILGIYGELPANTSWRFVDKAFVFPDPNIPFATSFPEFISLENIQGNQVALDFVSLKVGDVNGSARANSLLVNDDRSTGTLFFDLNDRAVISGETFDVRLSADQKVQCFQFTLNTEDLEVVAISGDHMQVSNFAVFPNDQAVTASWNLPEGAAAEAVGITLKLRAIRSGMLSEMLGVSSRFTKLEAYKEFSQNEPAPMSIALRYQQDGASLIRNQDFELYQNEPNPFVDKTLIGFNLPEASQATLTIYDGTGRLLYTQKGEFDQGYNVFSIEQMLSNTDGTLIYRLVTDTHTATKMMIQTR